MKLIKSITLLAAGATILLGACDKKVSDQNTNVQRETSTGTGEANAEVINNSLFGNEHKHQPEGYVPHPSETEKGTGAITTEEPIVDESEYIDEEYTDPETGASYEDMEYIDETSSEPNNVEGGRNPRLVPKNNRIENEN